MRDRPTVLFICSGNIFRSMTADFSLRAHLRASDEITIRSAGLGPPPHGVVDFVRDHLAGKGIDISEHKPTQLTPAMLEDTALPVAMGLEHREIIERDFEHRLPLFSEVAYGTVEALRDVWEVVPDWQNNLDASAEYGCSVIDYIHNGMPGFLERMDDFIARGSGKA
ncbi:low molecular weight phosphatase family protein [Denitrobaculum tricleocarpae]|nr:hypothetical protein [Denitrobaculum tricleocarpae]